MKLSDYVVQFVIDLGVKHIFFLPGGGAMHLNDSLGKRAGDITAICTLHEQAAAIAAENYARPPATSAAVSSPPAPAAPTPSPASPVHGWTPPLASSSAARSSAPT